MTELLERQNALLADFDRRERWLNAGLPPWVHRLRRAAIARFAEMGLPTTRHEEWRFTDLAPLAQTDFQPAAPPTEPPTLDELAAAGMPRLDGPRTALLNGRCWFELCRATGLADGVILCSLAEMLQARPEVVAPHLGRYADYRDHPFIALNTAFIDDGTVLIVPDGAVTAWPIHLVSVSTGTAEPFVSHPRNLILVGRHAEVQIVETYLGLDENTYFSNAVTEIVLAEGASVDHYRLQREGPGAFHMGTVQTHQGRGTHFSSCFVSLGGGLVRNETNTVFAAEGSRCMLTGLYLARSHQHIDCRTRIDHARPRCSSRELYRGILDQRAKGVFSGKIFVHQDAQKTDAKQTNQTLLLSDQAVVHTKPQLEIYADDVKCTHGATVGQLDAEAVFYLRSRGLSLEHARSLLVYGFADEILGEIRLPGIRGELEEVLLTSRGLPKENGKEKSQ